VVVRWPEVPALSIVIPTLNEAESLPLLLGDLALLSVPFETVVSDGGSTDGTPEIAASHGAAVLRSSAGRGAQLAAGADAASGTILCFLHADLRLDGAARAALVRAVSGIDDHEALAFTLRIDGKGWRYRFVEWGTDQRSRWLGMPYGDQGLLLTRRTYHRAGGFLALPLMEDVALVRVLRRQGVVRILPEQVVVSARRWRRDGVLRRMLRNWWLMAAYLAGVSPRTLATAYQPEPSTPGAP